MCFACFVARANHANTRLLLMHCVCNHTICTWTQLLHGCPLHCVCNRTICTCVWFLRVQCTGELRRSSGGPELCACTPEARTTAGAHMHTQLQVSWVTAHVPRKMALPATLGTCAIGSPSWIKPLFSLALLECSPSLLRTWTTIYST